MKVARLAALMLAAVTIVALAGCAKGQLPPSVRDGHVSGYETDTSATAAPTSGTTTGSAEASASGEASATTAGPNQYSGTMTEGGEAIGAEIQRTAAGDLAGKAWVMNTDGKAVLTGPSPQFALTAIRKGGTQAVVWKGASSAPGSGALAGQQTTFSGHVPADTVTLVLSTTLKPEGSAAKPPVLAVALSDVPVVNALDGIGESASE